MKRRPPAEALADVRDGLTRAERLVLVTLHALSNERHGRSVSSAELYGRVVEHISLSQAEFQAILTRLGAASRSLSL